MYTTIMIEFIAKRWFIFLAAVGLLVLYACAAHAKVSSAAPARPAIQFIEFYSPL